MSVRLPAFGFALLGTLGACGSDIGVDPDQPFSIGAGVGTMGAVIEPSLRTGPRSGVRIPIGLGSLSGSRTIDGIEYDVDTPLGGVGLIADYYPAANGFRISGGLFKSSFEIDGRATGMVEVGQNTYAGVDLRANIKPSLSVSPVIAVGYEGALGAGWRISTDVGVLYTGGLDGTASEVNGIVPQADLDAEISAINAELSSQNILPYIKFGATYNW